jgi:Tol biopolymer transport system component
MNVDPQNTGREKPLQSWKEIAAYLERDIRTAMRWEKELGLPVRRLRTDAHSSVYAYRSELEAWRARPNPKVDQEQKSSRPRRALIGLSAAGAVLVMALLIGKGPILNLPQPLVDAADGDLQVRQVWTGADVDTSGRVSPDGRYLTFVDGDGNLAIRDFQTGENRVLTDTSWESAPKEYAIYSAISPDGSQVAFGWINDRERARVQLRVGPLSDPSGPFIAPTVFADENIVYAYPVGWFPDGHEILAVLTRRDRSSAIARLSVETEAVQILKSFQWDPPRRVSLSPQGDNVVYSLFPTEEAVTHDLYLLSTGGGMETRLIEHPADEIALGWTPDGEQILFSSDRTGTLDLYAVPVQQGKPSAAPRVVKRNLGRVLPLGVTRDGSLYYGVSTGTDNLYSVSYDPSDGALDGEPELIHTIREGFATGPAWSPDGKVLAYTVRTGGGYNSSWTLVLRDSGTGAERKLPLALVKDRSLEPVWSPDGESLLVAARDRRTRDGLFRIDPQTGVAETLVLTGTPVHAAAWFARGESIFYVVGPHDDRRLLERNLTTGEEEELLSGTYSQGLAVSPDGKYLAVAFEHTIGLLSISDKSFREAVRVPDDPESPYDGIGDIVWADSGTRLLFVRATRSGASLWSVDVSSGLTTDLGVTMGWLGQWGLSVHPDGQNLIFHARGESERSIQEVWRLENLLSSDPRTESGGQP